MGRVLHDQTTGDLVTAGTVTGLRLRDVSPVLHPPRLAGRRSFCPPVRPHMTRARPDLDGESDRVAGSRRGTARATCARSAEIWRTSQVDSLYRPIGSSVRATCLAEQLPARVRERLRTALRGASHSAGEGSSGMPVGPRARPSDLSGESSRKAVSGACVASRLAGSPSEWRRLSCTALRASCRLRRGGRARPAGR
jgi:hypothetical protein